MAFMKDEITDKQEWLEIDGASGIEATPVQYADSAAVQVARDLDAGVEVSDEDMQAILADSYSFGRIDSATIRVGYGARLSAPGYLDCTEWAVFETVEDAEDYLSEMYGNDDPDADE